MSELDAFLAPSSIAIIGASSNRSKRGFRSLQKLKADSFPGPIYPVNPKQKQILGVPVFKDISECPEGIDLALICTPASSVADILRACGKRHVKGAVVLAGGFSETGPEGDVLQQQLVAAARESGVRVMGPNTSGMFNTHARCNLVGFEHLRQGSIGLLSQSGNMALALVTEAWENPHIGLSTYVGVGNESDIKFHEYLDFFVDDDHTQVIVAYIEGLKKGREFLLQLAKTSRHKPVVVYKSGRTQAGVSSAHSHTGALAGDYALSAAVLKQAGAVVLDRADDILPVAQTLSSLTPPKRGHVAILADGGGHATIAADNLSQRSINLARLSSHTQEKLRKVLPEAASVVNPVDVAGGTDADPSVFAQCVHILLDDENVDVIMLTGLYGGYARRFSAQLEKVEMETSTDIASMCRQTSKPMLVHSLFACQKGEHQPKPLGILQTNGIPVFASLEQTVTCVAALVEYGRIREYQPWKLQPNNRTRIIEQQLASFRQAGHTTLMEHEARNLLTQAGVALPPSTLACTADQAVEAFHALGDIPVVMKLMAENVVHKSDVGAVALDLHAENQVRETFLALHSRVKRHVPDLDAAGVLLAPMASSAHSVEVIIGIIRDPSFGPVMMFGLGGIWVEVLKDVVFRALPIDRDTALAMLENLRASALLDGVRGQPGVDKESLIRLMVSISELCMNYSEIEELDLNPVLATSAEAIPLDVRMVISSRTSEVD